MDSSGLSGHDVRLSAWGPYTKRLTGISHIPNIDGGLRFDLSVFPGLYRRMVAVPNVMWESGYHPWEAAPDLSFFSYRHEIVWKDQFYCDVSYSRKDESTVFIKSEFVNNTRMAQSAALHYLAHMVFPPRRPYSSEPVKRWRVHVPPGGMWMNALDYEAMYSMRRGPRDTLTYDGWRRGEFMDHGLVEGAGVQGLHDEDWLDYYIDVNESMPAAAIVIRYRLDTGASSLLRISGGVRGECILSGHGEWRAVILDVGSVAAGRQRVRLRFSGSGRVQLNGFLLASSANADEAMFEPSPWSPVCRRVQGPVPGSMLLKYADVNTWYGAGWDVKDCMVREFFGNNIEEMLRHSANNHVSMVIHGEGEGHFVNVFQRPLNVRPGGRLACFGIVCCGTEEEVSAKLRRFSRTRSTMRSMFVSSAKRAEAPAGNPAGAAYEFSRRRMSATVLTNVVYPVRTRGTWIRHYTPGRWWDCLYTWDSGFTGIGLAELAIERAVDCLNAYVTRPGEPDAAFIHHGSPVPVQFYLFKEIWDRTQSRDLLQYFYPRLQQYHCFMAGRFGSSTMRMPGSGMLRTWDYFYNSGGWDDYPAQKYVHEKKLTGSVAPAVTTAHVIRTARIMKMMAQVLGESAAGYDADITGLSGALARHSWDEKAGYFSYVTHDDSGAPAGHLKHESGVNFNMGMDGASPLLSGVCSPEQEKRIVAALFSQKRMWTKWGLSAVDQSAPYYSESGYWNGTIWFPHQWFFWKTMFDLGLPDRAWKIASTALKLWKREVDESYNCFEHFVIETGRGAGWHQFSGLSAPVLSFFHAYFVPGRVTTGFDAWIMELEVAARGHGVKARIRFGVDSGRKVALLVTLAPARGYRTAWNGKPVASRERLPGCIEVSVPASGEGTLTVLRA